jgi:hypothetical protein
MGVFVKNPINNKTATHDLVVKIMLGEPQTRATWDKTCKTIFIGIYWNYVNVPVRKSSPYSNDKQGREGD